MSSIHWKWCRDVLHSNELYNHLSIMETAPKKPKIKSANVADETV